MVQPFGAENDRHADTDTDRDRDERLQRKLSDFVSDPDTNSDTLSKVDLVFVPSLHTRYRTNDIDADRDRDTDTNTDICFSGLTKIQRTHIHEAQQAVIDSLASLLEQLKPVAVIDVSGYFLVFVGVLVCVVC